MRILVVDDDLSSVTMLSLALRRGGFDVITAMDGRSALDLVAERAPAIAIVDWVMPELDGLELCRRLRADPAHAHMYLLLLTGRTEHADMIAGFEAGADDYLTKPVDLAELCARVQVGIRVVQANTERERLLDSMSSILIRVDASGRVTRWNAAAQATFGIPAAAVLGRPLRDCGISWTEPELVEELLQPAAASARMEDLGFTDASGSHRLLGLTVTTLQRDSGPGEEEDGFVIMGAEVTTPRAVEQQLRQAQKLESIGQLAAGIAHEINTPMQYVGDNVRFLQDVHNSLTGLFEAVLRLSDDTQSPEARASLVALIANEAQQADLAYLHQEMPKAIQQSLDGVQHVSRIVKAMKDFSHPGTHAQVNVDLNRAIETTLTVARSELKYVADTVLDLENDLPLVPCLPGEINQVLLNLLINAAHAIGDALEHSTGRTRGRITVSTRRIEDTVEIRVADTGTGIPEEARSHIFEPFFTTKKIGQGTGQGLALAHAVIVTRHAGRIWFETEVGTGTTFVVRLPLHLTAAAPESSRDDCAIASTAF